MPTAARNGKHGRSIVLEISVLRLHLNESSEGFRQRGRGRSFHADGPKTKKVREPSVESGARTLGAESIRSRAESTEGCVKTEDSQRDTADLIHLLQRVFIVYRILCWIGSQWRD